MQEDNFAIRLKLLIQKLGITDSVFAEKCGISRATLSQLLTGRNKKISNIIVGQIHEAYPALSVMWLLFNEGDMWTGQPEGDSYSEANSSDDSSSSGTMDSDTSAVTTDGTLQNSEFGYKNPCEIPESSPTIRKDGAEPKENGLNYSQNTIQNSQDERINNCIKTSEILKEIEFLKKKSRKVVQITIYYDDSTFETFYPHNS